MGSAAAPYANELAGLLDDRAAGVRWTIVEGLKDMGPAGAEALATRLGDTNAMIREMARSSLEMMDPISHEAYATRSQSLMEKQDKNCHSTSALASPQFKVNQKRSNGGQELDALLPAHIRMRSNAPKGMLGITSPTGLSWTIR